MTQRILIWGFEGVSGAHIVDAIRSDRGYDIRTWVGDLPGCTHDVFDFLNLRFDPVIAGGPSAAYEDCYRAGLAPFVNMFSRHYPGYELSVHDFVDAFNMVFGKIAAMLRDEPVDLVLFANLPHEGPDLVLYMLAKRLGLQTVLLYQTLFDNRFFAMFDTKDFGIFDGVPPVAPWVATTVERTHASDYFYMRDVKPLEPRRRPFPFRQVASAIRRRDWKRLGSMLMRKGRYDAFVRQALAGARPFADFAGGPFVYFPLALQPELTTSALGGAYNDQVLALEHLAELLPAGWKIVVKENPKQTDFQRGDGFFRRLHAIPNVVLVDPAVASSALIERCEFVAAVTGTAGWEAIRGGKKALVFGTPWYASMPGVIRYTPELSFRDVERYRFDHAELEAAFATLMTKAGHGVIDDNYIATVPGFDARANAQGVLGVLNTILGANPR